MDLGFHHCISGAMMAQVAAEEGRQQSVQVGLDQMAATVAALDSRLDKQRFLESNHTAFMIPKKFEVQGTRTDDEVSHIVRRKCTFVFMAIKNCKNYSIIAKINYLMIFL